MPTGPAPQRRRGKENGFSDAMSVQKCPATRKRPVAVDADQHIDKPSVPRANLAISTQEPHGSVDHARKFHDYTVLQQHVLFWDRDGDGQIYPWDTYVGFRDLGFNILFSLLAMAIINFNFSYPTRLAYSFVPDPLFRVYVGGIHKAKHGSDSGVYDTEGRFVPQKFEDLFSKWDKEGGGSLTFMELFSMIHGNRLVADPFGWGASILEWVTTWLLVQQRGRVYKEDLRQVYDGSIFWRIREARRGRREWRRPSGVDGPSGPGGPSGVDGANSIEDMAI
ncbi:Caleosin related protein-domain-containing protein [Phialemonium atrogriseum]|uniref:Caleosin related protein-domain-containing protein n=1 Tax=Phialemonium atrogriseum TaxID=1093897 RepID=A0AAJ0BRZ3_9PEZI|nr:Caleosin related protein-domain-containing protein [Phialemonium atrogriseum]KAK1763165.1 Caleosin related protein-domain-containing protein [Phialemonium atrogriseum]